MNTQEMHAVMQETQAGELTFPEVVRRLSAVNVESYFCDFANREEKLYLSDGQTHVEAMRLESNPIASEFSREGIVAAIRGAQADTVRYPEFVKLATSAGVIAYWVFIAGRKVIYFGRKGEQHVEEFPSAKS